MKSFNVPEHYRSPLIQTIKQRRKDDDRMKKDFAPSVLSAGSLQVILARHFGFCYGVENAIEIAFQAIAENPGKRIFLLSEMIHNPGVNADLVQLGVRFIQDTSGNQLVPWEDVTGDDIVIIPAFGATLEWEQKLREKGIDAKRYETTCPFVEKVWNRAGKIGDDGYTIVIHGKPLNEETKATFSHSQSHTPTIVVKDMDEAILLGKYISGESGTDQFFKDFNGRYSNGFDPARDLRKIGVVNQTTMLASETQAISDYLKKVVNDNVQTLSGNINERFADTRDTLCYATHDNQSAVIRMLDEKADFALVIGGYNSSNTSHLVELCSEKLPVYFINDETCLISRSEVRYFDLHTHQERIATGYFPGEVPVRVMITSGASCPDALVERVIGRLLELAGDGLSIDDIALG